MPDGPDLLRRGSKENWKSGRERSSSPKNSNLSRLACFEYIAKFQASFSGTRDGPRGKGAPSLECHDFTVYLRCNCGLATTQRGTGSIVASNGVSPMRSPSAWYFTAGTVSTLTLRACSY